MQFIDSHCHLDCINLKTFDKGMQSVIDLAKLNQVSHMLSVGITLEDWEKMANLARPYPEIFLSVGVHPCHCNEMIPDVQKIEDFANQKNVIAIGETGLDYFYEGHCKKTQQESFSLQIEMAKKLEKPLIIHTRSAQKDTIDLLKLNQADEASGVIHCFTENWDMAKKCLDLGFYLSFSGIITFKNAIELREVAQKAPLDRLLIETDAPYLAPAPFRGKQNHPALVRYVAQQLADLHQVSLEKVAEQTTKNFKQLFKVNF